MPKFTLSNLEGEKDSLTGNLTFTQSKEYRYGMVIYGIFYCTSMLADDFGQDWFTIPGFIIAIVALVAAYFPYSFAKKAGTAHLKKEEIEIDLDEQANFEHMPDSPVKLDELNEININIVSSFRWWSSYIILQVIINKDGEEKTFGVVIKNRKQEAQYLEVLESWYRAGYPVKEITGSGFRVFKLNQGQNYAEVQKIKKKYGIEW
ncbi:hypothetical protein [Gracilimonas halophila]|uniref:Uncharacterized protein n=1 Tax=Gracilimonas halophila TaxID=1834464 RepID=A0ABW5JNG0_9BACT